MSDNTVVVIGGGIAGVAAARDLGKLGVRTILVEKSAFLGGHAVEYACKAAPGCQQCSACEVEKALADVAADEHVEVLLRSTVSGVDRDNGTFRVHVDRKPVLVDADLCTDCGLCLTACPAFDKGAVLRSSSVHVHPRFAIDPEQCLRLTGEAPTCDACVKACPVDAIRLEATEGEMEEEADAVVVATGFAPFDPRSLPHLGYGQHPDVVTALELEQLLRDKASPIRPSTGKPAKRVAFIQCVGSRDKEHTYCSRACCSYAIRMAQAIKERDPEAEVTLFYIDLQPTGKCFAEHLKRAGEELRLVRAMVGDVLPSPSGAVRVSYQDPESREIVDEELDLVVLSVGMSPNEDNETLASMLDAKLQGTGFFSSRSPLESNLTSQKGIVLAGTAEGPRDIADTIAHAKRAAWHVAKLVGSV